MQGMALQEVLSSWGINSEKIKGVNDVRMRFLPAVSEKKLTGNLLEFETGRNEKYRIKYRSLISKGSNGRVYEGHRSTNGGKGYTPLIVKKTKACLNSLRECVIQAMVYESIPENCPRIYNVFRTKNNLWIFMQDLRKVESNSYTLYHWLNKMSSNFIGSKEVAVIEILGRVFSMLVELQQKYMFKHGDLHTDNIYIRSSPLKVKDVFLIDFGYSMVKDRTKYSSSPYWLEYKDGVDCAILLWSLWNNEAFRKAASVDMLKWISGKLVVNGFNLKTLYTSADLYQKIDGFSEEDLTPLNTRIVAREFLTF